ncbi:MAG TPA: toll/interleukin-1 receptor domain-containing protein [Actinophytocola sp.]|uniref:toll/interleukin-1 receptor domain-containing protein n=1 Tax=Actinophytocola sp. TaxID=1872138 RepID=UPI002DDCEB97|nr:toll/interleukin-1 receptor domain-containing protein [Actinophytocola sp.]HEV2781168.1 toll/interleukin-1 receptor domain-containing protein [Actinophytocola sp.]
MSGKIFINYRQRDADGELLPHALLVEALADRLGTHFGRDAVYLDMTLRPGEPYPEALRARVADAAVLLVVIHPGWLADLGARAGRRMDWVHEEIATAIAAGIRLLPVVLDGAEPPKRHQLPSAIRALADAQAINLRFGSLADGVAAAIAEIELIVAPDVPERVTAVAPLPDRGRLVVVLLLFLASGVLGAFAAVTETVPLPELPPAIVTAVLAGAVLFYLLVILVLAACAYAIRRPMAWMDERLVRTPNRAYVVFGFGVVVVCLVALMAVAGFGVGVEVLLLTIMLSVGTLIAMGLLWLRNQERTPEWPHAPARPTPHWVWKALADLEHRLDTWPAPLPLSRQREALVAMGAIRGALATMSDPSSQTLLRWWRTRSPWITLPHSALAGAALTLATTALALHWTADGPDLVSTMLWLGAVLVTIGAYGGSLVFEHRRERWQIRTIAENAPARLAAFEERLSELSRPGLIAVHHTTARVK